MWVSFHRQGEPRFKSMCHSNKREREREREIFIDMDEFYVSIPQIGWILFFDK